MDLLQRALQLHNAGRVQEAISLYTKVLPQQKRNPQLLYLLGTANLQIGKLELGVKQLKQSLKLGPNNPFALNNLGTALYDLKRLDEALASYDKALALKPDYVEAYNNRGNALNDLKRLGEALASYDKALAQNPNYAEAHFNRGNALYALKRPDEALASYDRAVACRPDYVEAHNNRGNVLKDLNRLEEALRSYEKVLALKPDFKFLLGTYIHIKMKLCDWESLTENLDRLVTSVSKRIPVTTPTPLLSLLDSPELHRTAAQVYADSLFPKQGVLGPFKKRKTDGKIRVGYYSGDFRIHPMSYLIVELFEIHDRDKFEVYGFSFGPNRNDEMRQRVAASFDRFIDVQDKSDREVARISREMGIDIAIDLAGFTQHARTGIFAIGAAPIQVNYLGYPGTMAAEYIHYVIADKTIIPPENQSDYSEKPAYLPHTYWVNHSKWKDSDRAFTKAELGLPERGFVFCCFNNNHKILPATFDGWMRILNAVEGSVLWLLGDNSTVEQNLRREAEARGVDGTRLVFAERLPSMEEHMARHRFADLFLDTLPYNAHTTASDALWMGLPVLTCPGRSFAARVAASLLKAIDLPELITQSPQAFEAKAIELATHVETLSELKDKLERNRLTTPLFNEKLFARHMEAAYGAMFERYQAGLPPETIEVQPLN